MVVVVVGLDSPDLEASLAAGSELRLVPIADEAGVLLVLDEDVLRIVAVVSPL